MFDVSCDSCLNLLNMDSFNNLTANKEISKIRGQGRGYLLRQMLSLKISAQKSLRTLPNGNQKSNVVVHTQDVVKKSCFEDCKYNYEVPMRSTYIPPEPNENDDSIYDNGINSGINFDKFNDIEVKVNGINIPEAVESFETLNNLPQKVMENINKCKFVKLTPIQKHTIPIIFSGRDLLAVAQTGSGKTVAFILPIIQKLLTEPQKLVKDSSHSEPQVVIIVPTRELAVQIKMVVLKLTIGTGISLFACYGGTLVSYQKDKVLKGCHIIVATPGRLNEFVQHGFITFSSVRFFVLDEVDKMLDMDLKPEVDKILDHFSMPSVMKKQTIMLSATLPDSIQHLATFYLNKNYIFLAVGIVGSASKDIKQTFYQVNRCEKRQLLANILKKDSKGTIVFVQQKWIADLLASYLSEKHIQSISIHGDRLQKEREMALNKFRNGKMNVLVSTAVASRGLDIKCVNHVINYDMPKEIEEYVQRIGRTGRLGNQGIATSFFDPDNDYLLVDPIIKTLTLANQDIPNWLLQLGQKAKYNDVYDDDNFNQLGGTDIMTKSDSSDECEEW